MSIRYHVYKTNTRTGDQILIDSSESKEEAIEVMQMQPLYTEDMYGFRNETWLEDLDNEYRELVAFEERKCSPGLELVLETARSMALCYF